MRIKIVLVAAAAVVLLAWLSFRLAAQWPVTATELPPVASRPGPTSLAKALLAPQAAPQSPDSKLASAEKPPSTNFMALLANGEFPMLTPAQVAHYLEVNGRNAQTLLTAYQASGDRALLDEAIAKYPKDPQVAYTAWYRSPSDYNNDPEGLKVRRQALDQFKQAAPDNALGNYLSAANYFKSGQPELAVQEMEAGAGKPRYDDYLRQSVQSMTEAYQSAGYSDAESKAVASMNALLPHLAEMRQAGAGLLDLANNCQQAGDAALAQAARQLSLDLGRRLDDPGATTLIQSLVGMAVQRKTLEAMVATAPDAAAAQAAQAQLDAVVQERAGIKAMFSPQNFDAWLQTAPPQDISSYFDRRQLFGERQAMEWLANRNAK
jgi:hypothetical protein